MNLPSPRNNVQHIEQQAIAIKSGNTEITIVNIYIPPRSSCTPGYQADVNNLLMINDCLILGDVNAHHPLWDAFLLADQRGDELAKQIDQHDFGIVNAMSPTRIDGITVSSPDISLDSSSLIMSTSWQTEVALGSDHFPITITLTRSIELTQSDNKKYVNFAKANW